jgi:hypothetical protein
MGRLRRHGLVLGESRQAVATQHPLNFQQFCTQQPKKSAYTEGIERLLIRARLLIERHDQAVPEVLGHWPLLRD